MPSSVGPPKKPGVPLQPAKVSQQPKGKAAKTSQPEQDLMLYGEDAADKTDTTSKPNRPFDDTLAPRRRASASIYTKNVAPKKIEEETKEQSSVELKQELMDMFNNEQSSSKLKRKMSESYEKRPEVQKPSVEFLNNTCTVVPDAMYEYFAKSP